MESPRKTTTNEYRKGEPRICFETDETFEADEAENVVWGFRIARCDFFHRESVIKCRPFAFPGLHRCFDTKSSHIRTSSRKFTPVSRFLTAIDPIN